MTPCVPDDVVAKFVRQQHDWTERILKGSLDPVEVAQAIQAIINRRRLFNPHTYFKTRDGLYVWDTFAKRILSGQKESMPYRGLEGVTSQMLERNMSDMEIIIELLGGMKEVRTRPSSLDQVATMIDLQPNGVDGKLLNNGYSNIFYVLVDGVLFAVFVRWKSGDREWFVNAWHLDGLGDWDAGDRVFRNKTLAVL